MKKVVPTFEEFVNEDAREDTKKLKDTFKRKTKIKKDLITKHQKEKKRKDIDKSEITKAEINIKDKELDLLKDKASLIKQQEIFRTR